MRLPALCLLISLTAFATHTNRQSEVTITGDIETSFEGYGYVMAFDGFTVLALANAPIQDGNWQHGGSAFDYVELRLQAGLAEGTYRLAEGGGDGQLSLSRWNADGDLVDSFFIQEGTLVVDTVQDGAATGSLTASLTAYNDAGDALAAQLTATFTAHPENIPAP